MRWCWKFSRPCRRPRLSSSAALRSRLPAFTLALDDVIQLEPEFADLLALVEIVKVDIQPLSRVQLMQLVMKLKPLGKQLLAEKGGLPRADGAVPEARLQPVPGLLLCCRPSSPARNWTIRNFR